ncbi:MAG: ABC transporter substrate-binding protein [Reichenbachiella sp.]|uniref:ABC transporter substrate-binding protein n=1 Tax=Reichenbachiella sp. TaxID=2184521 RepID=UPI00329A0F39
MKTIRIYHLILCVLGLIVSCETRTKLVNHKEQEIIKTIRINFHDNILQLNPIKAESRSEQFVKDLVFDKLIEKDLSSHLFASYQVDSLLGLYTFQLEPDKSFHDGTPVNSDAFKNFFKYLLKNHYDDEYVQLFSSMDGFGPISWYRENRGIKDSIPSGFQIIDQTSFSIQLRTNKDKLLEWFQSPIFTLFKESSGRYIGSGDFQLKELNEDISAKLVRRITDNHKIETIQLSFIKNEGLVYSEFFRGALDIILYQPYRSKLTPQTKRLNKILNSQYPDYQITQNEKSILKFMDFKMFTDSTLLHQVIASINSNTEESIDINNEISQAPLPLDSLKTNVVLDSSYHQVQWYSELSSDSSQYFTNTPYLEFVETNLENINPTQPQIVIREMEVEFWPRNIKILSNNELTQELKGDNNSVILILDTFPEYVIYNNKLSGINMNTSFSNMVRDAYYQEIETY